MVERKGPLDISTFEKNNCSFLLVGLYTNKFMGIHKCQKNNRQGEGSLQRKLLRLSLSVSLCVGVSADESHSLAGAVTIHAKTTVH